jgi:hypothetical protein
MAKLDLSSERNNSLNEHVSVIIRSCGERTEEICKELILSQGIYEENITVIRKSPFSLALQKSFEKGIQLNRPLTLCVDADVLLFQDAIHKMILFMEQQRPLIFEVQFLVLDKFFGGARQAGVHLFRTSILPIALGLIPSDPGNIRPEQHTLEAMRKKGYPSRRIDYLTGLHDFEQNYMDIYRKSFIQAHKHLEYAEIFLSYWPKQAKEDPDFQAALLGYKDGLKYQGEVRIDSQQLIYRESFEKHHVTEKPALTRGQISSSDIEQVAKNWMEPSIYFNSVLIRDLLALRQPRPNFWMQRLAMKKKTMGGRKFISFTLGFFFRKIRRKMEKTLTGRKGIFG